HTPGYSTLFPPLGALLGPGTVGVLSALLATWSFALMASRWLPAPKLASVVFAAGTVTNLAVGRLTFALGLAVGLTALAALVCGHRRTAVAAAPLTSLASPVAGVFLILAAVAWAAGRPVRRAGVLVAFAAAVPLAVIGFA